MNHEALIANLVEEAAPLKPFNLLKQCCSAAMLLTAYLLVLVLIMGVRDDWAQQIATHTYALEMATSLALAYGCAALAMRLSVPREGAMPLGWLAFMLAATMGAIIWLLGQVSIETFKLSLQSDHFYISLGVILGATPVALVLFKMIRQGSPTQLRWAGAMALLSASATGHFLMRTIGQANNFADVFVWCYSPVLVLALLGIILGQKALRW